VFVSCSAVTLSCVSKDVKVQIEDGSIISVRISLRKVMVKSLCAHREDVCLIKDSAMKMYRGVDV